MASVSIEVTGMGEIQANLYRKLYELQNNVQAAIEDTTNGTFDDSQRDCPVDKGDLKASGEKEIGVLEGSVSYGNAKVDYPWYVELGTRKMHAQPFLGPNFQRGSMQLGNELKAMTV